MSGGGLPNCEGVVWTTVEPSVVEPTGRHHFTIVLCHGRGSTGPSFREEIFESTSTKGLSIRKHFPSGKWVFPSAGLPFDPREAVQDETRWFAMSSLKNPGHEQIRQRYGISESLKYLHRTLDQEIGEIHGKAGRVILGGISQGCAVAIHALLSSQHRLNSFVRFCSWLPFSDLAASASNGSHPAKTRLWNSYGQVFQIDWVMGKRGSGTQQPRRCP
jgi:lysophospholipase-2